MSKIFAELLTLGEVNTNILTPASAWTSTTEYRATCPSGKRWWLFGGTVNRNASSTCQIRIYDVADAVILAVTDLAAASGLTVFPDTVAQVDNFGGAMPFPMDAGDYLRVSFGTAQGAGAWCNTVVIEVDL